jgi:SAM-dependent methyltransferase
LLESLFTLNPVKTLNQGGKPIFCFPIPGENLDQATVKSFGQEWQQFHDFAQADLQDFGQKYFRLLDEVELPREALVADFGCGSGRWTRFFAPRAGHIIAIDPSEAIFAAADLLQKMPNVSLVQASIEHLPFGEESFDFAFSLGVLHHIPNTAKAMRDCVKTIKKGGYFLCYLYYNLDNRGWAFRALFAIVNQMRSMISTLPTGLKQGVCDALALAVYLPLVSISRLAKIIAVPAKLRAKLPLNAYEKSSFYILRNDALDRFGTPLEQRFSKAEIQKMMEAAGLGEIRFSDELPYWCALGQRKI